MYDVYSSVDALLCGVRHFFVHVVDTQNVTSDSCQCDRTQVDVTFLKYGSLTPKVYMWNGGSSVDWLLTIPVNHKPSLQLATNHICLKG